MQNTEISYFLQWQFIEAVLVTFVAITFVFFVGILSLTITISSHSVTEVYFQIFFLDFT